MSHTAITRLTGHSNTIKSVLPGTLQLPVETAVQIYQGAIVAIDLASGVVPGYATPALDQTYLLPIGIAENDAPPLVGGVTALTGAVTGTYSVNVTPFAVQPLVEVNYGASGNVDAAAADVGKYVYLSNDNCVDLVGVTSNDICFGRIVQVVSVSRVVVDTRMTAAMTTTL